MSKENFIKLKDGESVTGVLRGEEIQKWQKFNNRTKRYEESSHDDGGQFKFLINFIVKDNEEYKAKWLQGTWKTRKKIKALAQTKDLSLHPITVSRKGSTMSDTEYTVTVGSPLSEKTLQIVNSVDLLTLEIGSDKMSFGQRQRDTEEAVPF